MEDNGIPLFLKFFICLIHAQTLLGSAPRSHNWQSPASQLILNLFGVTLMKRSNAKIYKYWHVLPARAAVTLQVVGFAEFIWEWHIANPLAFQFVIAGEAGFEFLQLVFKLCDIDALRFDQRELGLVLQGVHGGVAEEGDHVRGDSKRIGIVITKVEY